ncbi:MAG: TolC family outer membrane protein [Burkholderiaceae bacterium]
MTSPSSMLLTKPLRLAAAVGLAFAPWSVQAYSLSEAVAAALAQDPAYLAAQQSRLAGQEKKPQGVAGLLPSVSGTAAARDYDYTSSSGNAEGLDYRSYSISLTQSLFNLSTIQAARQGFEQVKSSEAAFQTARQEALLRVAEAYFKVLTEQDNLASVQAEKTAIGEQLEQAKRSFEVGSATVTDQQEAQARFDLAVAKEIAASNSLNIARNALVLLTNRPLPAKLAGLAGPIAIAAPNPATSEPWVEQARTNSYPVLKAQAEATSARYEVTKKYAGHLPSLDLVANRTYNKDTASPDTNSSSNYVGLSLTVPLFAGGLTLSQTREASALKAKADLDLQAARLNAEQAARTAYLNVVAGLSQVTALEAAEKSSKLALDSNKLGYEVGVRINIDVLNAQQQLFAAQRDLSKARYDTLLASLKLRASVGSLQTNDLDTVSRLMQPTSGAATNSNTASSNATAAKAQ